MNQITDPPLEHDFGYAFNYANWTAGTRVSLVNVPWNNSYKDINEFDSKAALNAYITNLASGGITIDKAIQLKLGMPVRLDVPFSKALQFNYMRVSNSLRPGENDFQRDYFYFINGVNDISTNTTEFVLQLDVFQTFWYDVSLGMSFIERGHIGIANQNAFNNYGRDYLSIPEGFDLGSEYVTGVRKNQVVMESTSANHDIMVISATNFESAYGTKNSPNMNPATGDNIQNLPSGANYYFYNNIAAFMAAMGKLSDAPWIAQGIVSITAIPNVTRYGYELGAIPDENGGSQYKLLGASGKGKYTDYFSNWRNSAEIRNLIPYRYRNLDKLLTSPYMIIELTAFNATPITIKPENWNNPDARLAEKISLSAPNQRIMVYPMSYNAKNGAAIDTRTDPLTGKVEYYDDGGDYLDKATVISGFPTFAVVNNAGVIALASQAHSLAFQNQSAEWSQSRALGSNQLAYDQAGKSMLAGVESNSVNRQADAQSTELSNSMGLLGAAMGGVGAIGGGATPGGPSVGAGAGMALAQMGQAGMSMMGGNAALAIRNAAAGGQLANTMQNQAYMRDTTKTLADWAARGDYSNQIAGIQARVQDIAMTPPSTAGQVGGQAFNLANHAMVVSLRWKVISDAAMVAVGEYWLRYGYSVNRTARIDKLRVMTKFSYWKLTETYLIGGMMPEIYKTALRGIFEKGVTVWSNPEHIGNIDWADNEPLDGIVL